MFQDKCLPFTPCIPNLCSYSEIKPNCFNLSRQHLFNDGDDHEQMCPPGGTVVPTHQVVGIDGMVH